LFPAAGEKRVLRTARASILLIGVILGISAWALNRMNFPGLLELGFLLPGYTLPPVLGFVILAWMRRGSFPVLLAGAVVAVGAIAGLSALGVAFFWYYPVGAGIVVVIGLALSPRTPKREERLGQNAATEQKENS